MVSLIANLQLPRATHPHLCTTPTATAPHPCLVIWEGRQLELDGMVASLCLELALLGIVQTAHTIVVLRQEVTCLSKLLTAMVAIPMLEWRTHTMPVPQLQ